MSTNLRYAARQALEALETDTVSLNAINNAASFLRAALEQPEQEPVAWMDPNRGEVCRAHWLESHAPERDVDRFSCPLFTHPPRREWQGLTNDEKADIMFELAAAGSYMDCADAIEAALANVSAVCGKAFHALRSFSAALTTRCKRMQTTSLSLKASSGPTGL
jgi:hypothetical protein